MSEQAKVMDNLAITRSAHHDSGSHDTSLTGRQTRASVEERHMLLAEV